MKFYKLFLDIFFQPSSMRKLISTDKSFKGIPFYLCKWKKLIAFDSYKKKRISVKLHLVTSFRFQFNTESLQSDEPLLSIFFHFCFSRRK